MDDSSISLASLQAVPIVHPLFLDPRPTHTLIFTTVPFAALPGESQGNGLTVFTQPPLVAGANTYKIVLYKFAGALATAVNAGFNLAVHLYRELDSPTSKGWAKIGSKIIRNTDIQNLAASNAAQIFLVDLGIPTVNSRLLMTVISGYTTTNYVGTEVAVLRWVIRNFGSTQFSNNKLFPTMAYRNGPAANALHTLPDIINTELVPDYTYPIDATNYGAGPVMVIA